MKTIEADESEEGSLYPGGETSCPEVLPPDFMFILARGESGESGRRGREVEGPSEVRLGTWPPK